MNPEVKAAWLQALRSGDYPQIDGELRRNDGSGWCCLGVLCELHAKAGLGTWDERNCYLGFNDLLPFAVCEWAGLGSAAPEVDGASLIELNDGSGVYDVHTFDEIADLIEKYL